MVIAAVGKNSLHHTWTGNHDLVTISYDNTPNCDFYLKGRKYNLIYQILDKIPTYKNYLLIDDDILIENTDKFFYLFNKYKFELAQPSLIGYYSHKITLKQNCIYRKTNFVEIMMPCFTRKALEKCKETFISNESGWGIDYLWGKILSYQDMGIIDCVSGVHTRPVSTGHSNDIRWSYGQLTLSQSSFLV